MRIAFVAVVLLSSCSAVQATWVKPDYNVKAPDATKRIAVVAWAPADHAALAGLLSHVAADRIDLRMNYLVHKTEVMVRGWSDICGELEGVLSIRAIVVTLQPNDRVQLVLVAELHDCKTGALLWRVEGSEGIASEDDDLSALTESYTNNLGPEVGRYAAPAFLILRDMLETLPDPTLTDDEIMEKIELG